MKFAAAVTAGVVALASTASAQVDVAAVPANDAISYPEYLAKSQIESLIEADAIKPLILGGTEVPIGQKTWVVGLRSTAAGRDFCGGSLITPKHVLTAAHCAGSIRYVSVGSHYVSGTSDGEQIQVVKQTRHPSYSSSSNSNDFLILELASASKYAPVPLLTAAPATGTTATVAGWGTTSSGGSQSNVLLQVNVPIVAQTTCAQVLRVDSTMICAGGQANKDSCQGDSGGPLTVKSGSADAQVGVVSWGNGCGLAGYPGVYARVSVAKSWINSVTGNLAKWL